MNRADEPAEGNEPVEVFTETDRREEDKRIRHLRRLVDFTISLIAQSDLSLDEAQRLVDAVRQQAYRLFPDKRDTFELIYTPRFRRIIAEKFNLH